MIGLRTTLLELELQQLPFLDLLQAIVAGRGDDEGAVGFGWAAPYLDDYAIGELALRLEGMSAHGRMRLRAVG